MSHQQGGKPGPGELQPHLSIIHRLHNRRSGLDLGAFYDNCGISDGDVFLAIPMHPAMLGQFDTDDRVPEGLRSRRAMQDVSPVPLPALPPPATDEEVAAAEAELGYPLPYEVRALYSIARAGMIGIIDLSPIDEIASFTAENLESLDRDLQ